MAAPLNTNTRKTILSAAAQLLQNKSFSEITLADIARTAGISKGTLYYYYNNKNDILFDIANQYLTELADDLKTWAGDKSKDTSLHRLLHYVFARGLYNESGNLRLYLIGAAVSDNEAVRARLVEKYLYFKDALAQNLSERCPGADGEYAAWLILTVLDGLLVQNCLQNSNLNTDDFLAKTQLFLEEILKNATNNSLQVDN